MLARTSAKTPTTSTKMQLFVTFSFTASGCNIIRARKINIELCFEISLE